MQQAEAAGGDDACALDAYLALGRFADAQYQNIVTYTKSSTFEAKQVLIKQAKDEMQALDQIGDGKRCGSPSVER